MEGYLVQTGSALSALVWGLRVICAGLDNDPMKIGIHMLEMVEKFRREGLYDVIVDDEEEEETVDGSLS